MAAMFEFNVVAGIVINPDPADNPDGHTVPHHDAGVQIQFEIINTGDEDGKAEVGVELDNAFVGSVTSAILSPGQGETGVYSLGRLTAGSHTVLAYVNPGSGQNDNASNTFNVA